MIRYVFVYRSGDGKNVVWYRHDPENPHQKPEEQQVILRQGTTAEMIERMAELSGTFSGSYHDINLGTVFVFQVYRP